MGWLLVLVPLINKIKMVSDIGWSSEMSAWNCHHIHDNAIGLLSTVAMKCLHWSLFCQKKSVRKFSDEFSKYVLQQDEFSKCIFHLGPVFFKTRFPYTGSTGGRLLRARAPSRVEGEHLGWRGRIFKDFFSLFTEPGAASQPVGICLEALETPVAQCRPKECA